MMKVKIFLHKVKIKHPKWWGGTPFEFNHTEFEDEINNWIKDNSNVKIIEIKQSTAGGSFGSNSLHITTSIWYEEST